MNLGLNNKTILITGGTTGLGRATALAFGKEKGTQVAITYRTNKKKAEYVVNKIKKESGIATSVFMDLADYSSIQKAILAIKKKMGHIDILINNAIYWGDQKSLGVGFEKLPISNWEDIIGVNLFGTIKVTQEVVPFMLKKKWGRIVNISSEIIYDSSIGAGPYGTLKASLLGFTANLVEEFSSDGIYSNCVIPGWILTDKTMKHLSKKHIERASLSFPTRRITKPEDVASLILFLSSKANKNINGENIKVNGKGSLPLLNYLFNKPLE